MYIVKDKTVTKNKVCEKSYYHIFSDKWIYQGSRFMSANRSKTFRHIPVRLCDLVEQLKNPNFRKKSEIPYSLYKKLSE